MNHTASRRVSIHYMCKHSNMSLRAERSNLFFFPVLDCFVALLLAMTAEKLWDIIYTGQFAYLIC
jgi:hypothetical protein